MPCLKRDMSRVVRKPPFCISENKDADQLRSNCKADHRLCFRYTISTIPLLSKSEIPSLYPSSVGLQPGLCQIWSETPKTGFLTMRLILLYFHAQHVLQKDLPLILDMIRLSKQYHYSSVMSVGSSAGGYLEAH